MALAGFSGLANGGTEFLFGGKSPGAMSILRFFSLVRGFGVWGSEFRDTRWCSVRASSFLQKAAESIGVAADSAAIACTAHKSLKICEQCRLSACKRIRDFPDSRVFPHETLVADVFEFEIHG